VAWMPLPMVWEGGETALSFAGQSAARTGIRMLEPPNQPHSVSLIKRLLVEKEMLVDGRHRIILNSRRMYT